MLNFKIAFRFLIKKPIQTLIATMVIAVGVAIFYFILNAGDSLKKLLYTTTAETNSHIHIVDNFEFNNYDDEIIKQFRDDIFKSDLRVTDVAYSYTIVGATKNRNNDTFRNFSLKGFDFDYSYNIQNIGKRIDNHRYNSFPQNIETDEYFGEIVIGNGFASYIGFENARNSIGKYISVYINDKIYKFKIVGTFNTDNVELGTRTAFTTIETVQKITNLNIANAIEIKVINPMSSTKVLNRIEDVIKETYPNASYLDWQYGNRFAVNALYIEDVSIVVIQIFTAVAISFGVTALLSFMIREKINQIGILKALGLNNYNTRQIFLLQIIIIAIPSIIGGLFFGDFLAKLFTRVFRRPNSGVALIALRTGIWNMYSLISAIVMFVGCIVATIPAIRYAEKLKVIEVIKNE